MAYDPQWERLSDALMRLMTARDLSKEQAQTEICQAIADGAIRVRGKLDRHTTRHMSASSTTLDGKDFRIPEIKPGDFDWNNSRPLRPWMVRRGAFEPSGSWALEWMEVHGPDLTKVLCQAGNEPSPPITALRKTSARSRTRPTLERAQRAIKELFPGGIPDQAAVPNAILCGRVGEKLKRDGLRDVSDDTILRAAGRRK